MPHAKQSSMKPRQQYQSLTDGGDRRIVVVAGSSNRRANNEHLTPKTELAHKITLCEEEISDVSLATFYVFDSEKTQTLKFRTPGGGCGCAQGCGG